MAKKKKNEATNPEAQGSENQKGKTNGLLFGLIAFLVATFIMVTVVGGAFYFVIKNNINGLADKYRSEISGIPILRWALPKQVVKDPYDPTHFTDAELKSKYNELRKLKDDLTKQLDDAKKQIADLQKVKASADTLTAENTKLKADAASQKAAMDAQQKSIDAEKKAVAALVAKGDTAGFKAYFEQIDPTTAAKLYTDILTQQKISNGDKTNAKLYNTMDPKASAKIFEQMGTGKIDLVVNTLKNMDQNVVAQVMANLSAPFAAKVSEQLHKAYTTP